MASTLLNALINEGTHGVGSLNSLKVKTLAVGAVAVADTDNFTLVQLDGFNEEGDQKFKQLGSETARGYLLAAVEQRFMNEDISHFYVGEDEKARLVVLEPDYTRFETSSFTKNAALGEIKKGQVAHFDVATKKYIISKADAAHAKYATAANKFSVVGTADDTMGNFMQETVRLMAI